MNLRAQSLIDLELVGSGTLGRKRLSEITRLPWDSGFDRPKP